MNLTPSGPGPGDGRSFAGEYIRRKLIMFAVGVVLLSIIVLLAFISSGFEEAAKTAIGLDEPQEITLAKLAEDGPQGNEHIELRDFSGAKTFVFEARGGVFDEPNWDVVFVALVPKGGTYDKQLAERDGAGTLPEPSFRVLLKSREVRNEAGLNRLLARRSLRGLVVNRVAPLSARRIELIGGVYPNADLSQAWVLEHGRPPILRGSLLGFYVGILILVVGGTLGVWLYVRELRRLRRIAKGVDEIKRLGQRDDAT